ncbi:MAG: hypothetical protein DUD27_02900 [Lachnospiraceae bacterium]|uniref:WD40 repeat domain-containing protein n=1 Tax=Candidatus Weimeria bifida TaxID=2599074 RepID=A0A6N7J0F9_9FIRM|nr:hypothetical protein [Candidatus Weimeria bifida]RRF96864.1 MAG: hypothetical protein DUD27_02900 [Lachnospiraceae bacterium]
MNSFFNKRRVITLITAAVLVVAVIVIALWQNDRSYDSYDVEQSFSTNGASAQNFVSFADGLMAYSRDGAQLYDSDGRTLWNESYNMQNPEVRISGDRLLIYDRGGSTFVIMSPQKEISVISTTHPIVQADIASNGISAVLTEEEDTGYINIYKADGTSLADGQVHLSQTGYPMSIAMSDDGTRLIMSLSVIKTDSLATQINIYDFTDAGDQKKDNIIASFKYDDTVCPQTAFFSDGSAAALTDSGAVLYTSGNDVKEKKKIKTDFETESVIMSGGYFGLIHRTVKNDKVLEVYDDNGRKTCTEKLDASYKRCSFLRDDLLIEQTGEKIRLFDVRGKTKFSYTFPDEVIAFEAAGNERDYFLIQPENSQIIKLN